MSRFRILVAIAALTACASPETPQQAETRIAQESAAFKTFTDAANSRWESFAAAGQADSIASLFAENGRELPPNEPAAVGREAIAKYEARSLALFDGKLAIISESVIANGPVGIERGTWGFEGKAKKGAPKGTPAKITDGGNFIVHWHNNGGAWQIAELIHTTKQPTVMMAAMQAAAKKAAAAKKPTTTRRR